MRFACSLLMLALVGCNNPQQREWLNTMLKAGGAVDDSTRYKYVPIETKQLIEIAGEPDLRMRQQELLTRVKGNEAYRAYIKGNLQQALDRYRLNIAERPLVSKKGPASVDDCMLWLYDESKRFPSTYRTSAKVGYSAYFFLVSSSSQVIGAASVHHWQGLESR